MTTEANDSFILQLQSVWCAKNARQRTPSCHAATSVAASGVRPGMLPEACEAARCAEKLA